MYHCLLQRLTHEKILKNMYFKIFECRKLSLQPVGIKQCCHRMFELICTDTNKEYFTESWNCKRIFFSKHILALVSKLYICWLASDLHSFFVAERYVWWQVVEVLSPHTNKAMRDLRSQLEEEIIGSSHTSSRLESLWINGHWNYYSRLSTIHANEGKSTHE